MMVLLYTLLLGGEAANLAVIEPRFLNKHHVVLEQHSRVQLASFVTNIWPARMPYAELKQVLQQVEGCTIFQTEAKQVSCVGSNYLLSIYIAAEGMFWSEAYLDEQLPYQKVRDEKGNINAVPVSIYTGDGYQVESWITQDTVVNLYRQAVASAQGAEWRISLNDLYAGSFVLAKESHAEKVSMAGWLQSDGRVFVTRITEK
ncbi:hypothetical protein A28LD_0172 [Idiomarina sp. A28L]|uniref:hypothetical protein n=1 Tax=Idiomarina sp. A28L TaxID=1036674 RepID=UPI00021387BE|nr:hypothetical protein [Idiomarina sp. A28L]EGN76429.1 hypothetical protein A28LD_0172 [Idiomarina sp. A28L]